MSDKIEDAIAKHAAVNTSSTNARRPMLGDLDYICRREFNAELIPTQPRFVDGSLHCVFRKHIDDTRHIDDLASPREIIEQLDDYNERIMHRLTSGVMI
jgi:hypothetical protein